jgi:transcriptional repressor NF-X1
VEFDPDSPSWSCGQPCLTPLHCNAAEVEISGGKVEPHICETACHPGPCPPCVRQETVTCFCGKHSKEIACSDKEFPKKSAVENGKSWIGFYHCQDMCGRYPNFRKR